MNATAPEPHLSGELVEREMVERELVEKTPRWVFVSSEVLTQWGLYTAAQRSESVKWQFWKLKTIHMLNSEVELN